MKTKLHVVEGNVGTREKCESSRLHVSEKIKVSDTFSNFATKKCCKNNFNCNNFSFNCNV